MAKKKTVTRSNEERILRVWDIETIKDLMSRRTIYEARTGATMWAWMKFAAIM